MYSFAEECFKTNKKHVHIEKSVNYGYGMNANVTQLESFPDDTYIHTYITFLYPRILRVAYAANFSEHLTIR